MLAFILTLSMASACTYFEVPQRDAGLVIARSMELPDLIEDMRWRVVVHSHREVTKFLAESGDSQANVTESRRHRFGFVSIDGGGVHGLPTLYAEGLSEQGLSVSANVLHGSVYESFLTSKPKLPWKDVVPFLLGSFANVSEALAGLADVAVVGGPKPLHALYSHWALADASGDSAIVEFLNGDRVVRQGPTQHVGVMTNDPPLDWQIVNLNQYVNLRPDWPSSNNAIQKHLTVGAIPTPIGHGFNLGGLPGDASAASRFVRTFYLREYAMANLHATVATRESTILLATGLLNNVYLTKGTIAKAPPLESFEYTPWAVIKIPSHGIFLYRTAADMTWKQIQLSKLDFATPGQPTIALSMTSLGIDDVTDQLTPLTRAESFGI